MNILKKGTVVYNNEHGVGVVLENIGQGNIVAVFENGKVELGENTVQTPQSYEEFDEYFAMASKGSNLNKFLEESFQPATNDIEIIVDTLNESDSSSPSVLLNKLSRNTTVDSKVIDTLSRMMKSRKV